MNRPKLSKATIDKAIEALDWPRLKTHLDGVHLDAESFADLLLHIRRSNKLVVRHGNAKKEARRDAFLSELKNYVHTSIGDAAAAAVTKAIEVNSFFEKGYREILSSLDGAPITKLPADVRVGACLAWAT